MVPNAPPPITLTPHSNESSSLLVVMDSPTRISNMDLSLKDPALHDILPGPRHSIAGQAAAQAVRDFDKQSSLVPDAHIATLKWSDLQVGDLLGTGAFSKVSEVHVGRNLHQQSARTSSMEQQQEQQQQQQQQTITLSKEAYSQRFDETGSPLRNRRCWDSVMHPTTRTFDDAGQLLLEESIATTRDSGCWNMESVAVEMALLEDATDFEHSFDNPATLPLFEPLPSFALKHLDFSKIKDQRALADYAIDIVMEARLLSCLQHENIVKLFAVAEGPIENAFSTPERGYFLVLSRLYGTLEDKLKEWSNKTPLSDRLSIALEIAQGMRFVHQHSIIYRDLKPQNIGLSLDGTVKIYDFGLSRELPKPGQLPVTDRTGSVRYMAPEVVLRKAYGLEVDVYSFAIVLWEICSLNKPFHTMTSSVYFTRVAVGNERPSLEVLSSAPIKRLLTAAWAPKHTDRPSFIQIVNELTPPPPVPARTDMSKSRKPTAPVIAGLLTKVRTQIYRRKVSSSKERAMERRFVPLLQTQTKVNTI